ncbi:hypothetical protein FACS1894217_07200 [Clostridia bacterium]|nr:hypothetical protein FACS1894217_07200 [Clostridia bacterium]GHV32321.1 hypothetical protein FACS18949_02840 [Clostridia bacterium]
MAVIGSLSNTNTNIIFSVSRSQVNTFDNLQWNSTARYATHDRHLRESLLEFTGTDADKMPFSMYFSTYLGVDPITEIAKLLNAERSGQVLRLVIGPKAYGRNRWVIDGTNQKLEKFDNKGRLLVSKVDVSLVAYAGR